MNVRYRVELSQAERDELTTQSQTASAAAMGDSARRQRGLCRRHGRCSGGLSQAARSHASPRLPRRNLEAADRRDAHADPRQTRTTAASRLRIRTQRRGQSVHAVRAAGRLAPCQGHRPPHSATLPSIMPTCSGNYPTCIFPTRQRSCWCRIISTPTSPPRFTKPSPPPKRVGSSSASNGITRPMLREPQHGSWLDMAETELGVLTSQYLDRRIADQKIMAHQVGAWRDYRNKHHAKANWQFTTTDARVKLKRQYRQFE
jgi:hypothetical protein